MEFQREGRPFLERFAPYLLGVLAVLFVAVAWPRAWYNDDAFITFRYARHLAQGFGFVWNTVDPVRVEGSSSLGWTYLNAVAIALGLKPVWFSHALGLLSGVAGLVLVYVAARRLLGLSPWFALLAPAVLAAHRQWVIWSVSSLETRTATVLAFAALLAMAFEQRRHPPGWAPSGALFFAATLFRPEVPLLHAAAGTGFALARPRRENLVAVVLSGLVHAVGLAGLTVFRLLYFGQPLPNTFYAKVGGIQLARGLRWLAQFPLQNGGWLLGPLLLAGLFAWWLRRRHAEHPADRPAANPLLAAIGAQAVAWCAWVAVEGGGGWEFRFLDFLLPGLALAVAAAAASVGAGYGLGGAERRGHRAFTALLSIGAIAVSWWTLAVPFRTFDDVDSAEHMKQQADALLAEGRQLARVLTPEDRICIGWAGALPYVTDAWHFDPWGLNDPEIARRPFRKEGVIFHQRQATWDDVVDRKVMFCDVYNQFLYRRPYPPNRVPNPVMPWARDGILVHCIDLGRGPWPYWIFASPRPVEEIRAWAERHGLRLVYSLPLRLRPTGAAAHTLSPAPPAR